VAAQRPHEGAGAHRRDWRLGRVHRLRFARFGPRALLGLARGAARLSARLALKERPALVLALALLASVGDAALSLLPLSAAAAAPASGFAPAFSSPAVLASVALDSAGSALARFRCPSLSDLKSVSYQPEPLRRKTGADIRRLKPLLPQDGHFFRGLSLIFWR